MTLPHPLDRPIWNALTSRQANLALGDGRAVRFAPEYGLFAAAADGSPESLAALTALIPPGGVIGVQEFEPPQLPGTRVLQSAPCDQMIAEALTPAPEPAFEITPLADADGPEMLALATLARPGPFFSRTHQLGDFVGVKQDGRLVAMAGERMKLEGFTEVSGVCTHPDHRGRGYAGALMRVVAERILARGEQPILHVYTANTGAIALYETLGFRRRTSHTLTLLERE